MIGGTGIFGSRLVEGIRRTTDLAVTIATRTPSARPDHIVLDATTVTPDALKGTGAFAIIDAAGPFQGGNHHLAKTAIAAGLHYIDLADARDFIAGFPALDAEARAAGVVALTGASSTPALSNAALDHLTWGWQRIDTVEIAIAPGNRAPRGLSVVRAILSYAGHPVRLFTGGAWTTRPGWGMTVRHTIPGIGRRWLGLCETADLDLIPARFAVRQSAIFRAGLELSLLHLGLLAASLPVRAGLLRSLAPFARPFRALAALFTPFGTDRGGMAVTATGLDAAGTPIRAQWALVAESGHGPVIPTLPALAALRALATGTLSPGARPCVDLPLAAITAEFAGHRITAGITPCLFATALGPDFSRLPAAIRHLHHVPRAAGKAEVDGPQGPLARLVAAIIGLPAPGMDIPVAVTITATPDGEIWERNFAGSRFTSHLSLSRAGGLAERFGPLTFDLAVTAGPAGIGAMAIRAWRIGPLPLPCRLAPISIASETIDATGRFRFDVALHLPFRLGRIVRYRGWLLPR